MTFSEFLEQQYLAWQNKIGKRKTIEEFAFYIGVSRPLLNMWLNGDRKPGKENVRLLADTFGLEVYDVLGVDRPNKFLYRINQVFDNIPPDKQQQLAEQAERFETENERNKISRLPKAKKA
jgi:transcriptional regulator with XRE-family HTH domain